VSKPRDRVFLGNAPASKRGGRAPKQPGVGALSAPVASVGTGMQPLSGSLGLRSTFPDVDLIERVRRGDKAARAELIDRVRNKSADEEVHAVCDLAAGTFKFDRQFKSKRAAAGPQNTIASYAHMLQQGGLNHGLVKAVMKAIQDDKKWAERHGKTNDATYVAIAHAAELKDRSSIKRAFKKYGVKARRP
jgi:hypothetical protein